MGEYAIRKSDSERVKIGTCEAMYYLRFEDRFKVQGEAHSVDPSKEPEGLFFRIPFRDEDNVPIGEYKDHNRGLRLYHFDGYYPVNSDNKTYADFNIPDLVDRPGIIQLRHDSGLLVNVSCYHGIKLPEVSADFSPGWNGKSWSLELVHLKAVKEGENIKVYPIVHCRHCRNMWRFDWSDIWNDIPEDMRERFEEYRGVGVAA